MVKSNIKKYRFCPLCSSCQQTLLLKSTGVKPRVSSQVRVTDKHFGLHGDIIRCKKCNFVYIGDKGYVKKVVGLYKNMSDEVYLQEEKERRISFINILKNIETLRRGKKGKLFDIGCCTGGLLVDAKIMGWLPYGIDPSSWACRIAYKRHRLRIFNGKVENYKLRHNYFDAVTLLDVLEHVEDPNSTVKKIFLILKRDGVFCVVTPNYESLASKILGKRWWGIRLGHVSYFDEESLGRLMKGNGFRLVKKGTYTRYFSLYYILVRLLPLIEKTDNVKSLLKKITIPLTFFDSFEYYYRKR